MSSYLITCRSCGSANRVPDEKQGIAGHCGNCRAALPPLYFEPQQVNDENFDAFLAGYSGPIIAEFWAPW